MMAAADVRRVSTSDQMVETATGIQVPDRYEVDARSRLEARSKVRQYRGVLIGAPYRDQLGATPDPRITYQQISVAPKGKEGSAAATRLYIVDATAGFELATFGAADRPPLEVDGPAQVIPESVERDEPVDTYTTGEIIANSAGVPVDPPLTVLKPGRFYRLIWLVSGYEWADLDRELRRVEGHLNADVFMGAQPRELMIHQALPSIVGVGTGLVRIEMRIEYRPTITVFSAGAPLEASAFDVLLLDQGMQEINPDFDPNDAASRRLRTITTESDDGSGDLIPISQPIPLDGFGAKLAAGDDPVLVGGPTLPETPFNEIGVQIDGY